LTVIPLTQVKVTECLNGLWQEAFKKNSIDALFALLRVTGMQSSGWDSSIETEEAFEDYNWHLKARSKKLSDKSGWRIGLLMYCHACEMSSVHSTLKNLLNISLLKPFQTHPFIGSVKKKKGLFNGTPPSAKTKWNEIIKLAKESNNLKLIEHIENVYNDAVRNAFSHSDYIISDNEFRWTEAFPGAMPLVDVHNLISNSFIFFSSMLSVHKRWNFEYAKLPRYLPMPNFEVLELLKNKGVLNGFKVHFSSGTHAEFQRTDSGVTSINLILNSDGPIGFQVGDLDELKACYVVEGIEFPYLTPKWTDNLGY
jgi:hypothetical protein